MIIYVSLYIPINLATSHLISHIETSIFLRSWGAEIHCALSGPSLAAGHPKRKWGTIEILWMEEILHQLIGGLSYSL
jgi:hypothetical protein